MRCKHCGKMSETHELLGIKGIVCCQEYQVDIWSLRPRVRVVQLKQLRDEMEKIRKTIENWNI